MMHVGALQYCFSNNTHTNHATTTQSLTQLESRKHSAGHRLSLACWTVYIHIHTPVELPDLRTDLNVFLPLYLFSESENKINRGKETL